MEFSKIIAVTGKPGLFQVISQSKNAIIVESLNVTIWILIFCFLKKFEISLAHSNMILLIVSKFIFLLSFGKL